MDKVPEEILLEILQHVTNKEVMRCARLNKKFNAMISRNFTKLPRSKRNLTVEVQKGTDGSTYYIVGCGHDNGLYEWYNRKITISSNEMSIYGQEQTHAFPVKHALYCYLDAETCPREQPKSTSKLRITDQNQALRGVIGYIARRFVIRRLRITDKIDPSLDTHSFTDEERDAWYDEQRRNVDELEDIVVEELLRHKAKVGTLDLLDSIPMAKIWKLKDQLQVKGFWLDHGDFDYEEIDEIIRNLGDLSLRLVWISSEQVLQVIENWKRGTQKDVCYNFFEVDMHWYDTVEDNVVQNTKVGPILRFRREADNRELYCKVYYFHEDGSRVSNLPFVIMKDKEPTKHTEEFDYHSECMELIDSEWSTDSEDMGLDDPYDFDEFEEHFTDFSDMEMDEEAQ